MNNETIAAVATAIGQGGIGVIRMSGENAFDILDKVFRTKRKLDLSNVKSHTIHYGRIYDGNNGSIPVDEVLVSIMRAPNTYTKENIVEISTHANTIILQKILEILIKSGARLAEPGEFTKRAFLNGRIDLSQAEAVIDLINAKTEIASKTAIRHLEGELSSGLKSIQHIIKEMLINLEAKIDFPEDNIEDLDYKKIYNELNDIKSSLRKLVDTYIQGKILKDGINIVIVGRVNVGKSSLFNRLIDLPSRALVTDIPGTTRDYIKESVNIQGKLFNFTDTAGFKIPRGKIETESINSATRCINEADTIIFILDGSMYLTSKDLDIWSLVSEKNCILCVNKIDLPQKLSSSIISEKFSKRPLYISCSERKGIEELKEKIAKIASDIFEKKSDNDIIITNIRHKNILEQVVDRLGNALSAIDKNLSVEFLTSDLRHALEILQELTGERISGTLLNDIFSRFCIGK